MDTPGFIEAHDEVLPFAFDTLVAGHIDTYLDALAQECANLTTSKWTAGWPQ